MVTVHLNVRRFYLSENPSPHRITLELDPKIEYADLKVRIHKVCEMKEGDGQVIKLRNMQSVLLPLSFLLHEESHGKEFLLDISNISCGKPNGTSLLHDAYVDAVCNKVKNIESRISQAEMLLPQLQWRRQTYMDEKVNGLLNKVIFLNKRFDDLLPPQWRSKMPETMA